MTSCGPPPYVVNVDHRTLKSKTCADVIPTQPIRFSIAVGGHFQIEISQEVTGALYVPIPRPARPSVIETARHGATIVYEARRRGTTSLIAHHTLFCVRPHPRVASCTVAVVRVTAP